MTSSYDSPASQGSGCSIHSRIIARTQAGALNLCRRKEENIGKEEETEGGTMGEREEDRREKREEKMKGGR